MTTPQPSAQRRSRAAAAGFLFAVVAALAATGAGCGRTRACRTGTIFLQVRAGAFAGSADGVAIDVAVDGSPDAQQTLALPTASAGGGVEIQFAAAYPAGRAAIVRVTLEAGSRPIAERTLSTTLAPGCTSLLADFASTDASDETGGGGGTSQAGGASGAGGAPAPGTGGASATGGQLGNGGSLGVGGSVPGLGGRAGAMGGGGGGGGASIGTGGAPGGSPGFAGSSGSGTGGSGTGGGAAGQIGSAGGAGGGCVRTGAENCYDRIDNDCNGSTDCEDPACTPVATCATLDPAAGTIGVSIDALSGCPTDAGVARSLVSGVDTSSCSGQCTCGQGSATLSCSAAIYGYASDTECADTNAPGTKVHDLTLAEACYSWAWPSGTMASSVYGVRLGGYTEAQTGMCEPTSTLVKGPPAWSATTKFCGLPAAGAGCGAGAACVPRSVTSGGACLLIAGTHACPAGLRKTDWYSSAVDSRTCSCTCGAPTGGTCNSVLVEISDACAGTAKGYARNNGGERVCLAGGLAAPALQLSGTPIAPTCAPMTGFSGSLSLGGQQTLCCM